MQLPRRLLFVIVVTSAVFTSTPRVQADDLAALNAQVTQLSQAGKFAEALPIAERYAEGIKALRGADHPEYATALSGIAMLLRACQEITASF